ncbi:MAG: dimethylsulfoniopropionate demethylase [Hyphomicrobiaceae bacterium]
MSTPILAVSRRTRRTPFTERLAAHGVKGYTVYNHMLLPTAFRSLEEDYWHLRRHVQVWDVFCERQVELKGPDAFRLTQMMTPRDLSRIEIGQCVYAPIIDEAAGMINDPVVIRLGEDRFWLSIADSDVVLWAGGLAHGLDLDVEVFEPDAGPLAVQGPRADDLMALVFGDEVRRIRFFRSAMLSFMGHPLLVARSGWSKQGGFEIYVDDWEVGRALYDRLFAVGEVLDVGPGCPNLIERIEGGLLSYGNDMTRANNPLECGLERYCSPDSRHEHIGRAALDRIRANGPARMVRGVRLEGAALAGPIEPWPVRKRRGRAQVGAVSSATWSPRFSGIVGFAMMEASASMIGTSIEVETPEGMRSGVVVALPFEEAPGDAKPAAPRSAAKTAKAGRPAARKKS